MNNDKRLVHTEEIRIRWGDLDALGHVNAAKYFVYFEQARVEYLARLGKKVEFADEGPVIINAACTFLKQVHYPSTILLDLSISEPGRSSFMMTYDVKVKGNNDNCAEGSSKVVWVNYKAGKSIPLPDFIRAEFE